MERGFNMGKKFMIIGACITGITMGMVMEANANTWACTATDSTEMKNGKMKILGAGLGKGEVWIMTNEDLMEEQGKYQVLHSDDNHWVGYLSNETVFTMAVFDKLRNSYSKSVVAKEANNQIQIHNSCVKVN